MIPSVRRLGPNDWRLWRDVRLVALEDSPSAFGSSLARERTYTDTRWRDWLDPANGLKVVAGDDAGLVGAWLPPDRGGAAELYGMWVRSTWRGKGDGDLLVEEVLAWAGEQGHPRVDLWVVEGNKSAERLYRRHGFQATEETQPHPSHAGVLEFVMTRQV